MATYTDFDNIEETCTVQMTDTTEQNILITSLQAQIDKYDNQIDSKDKETDFVEVEKRDKFQNYLDRVNEFIIDVAAENDNTLLLVTKGELQSWGSAINDYYQKNKFTLTEAELLVCTTLLNEIDTSLISIDRKT